MLNIKYAGLIIQAVGYQRIIKRHCCGSKNLPKMKIRVLILKITLVSCEHALGVDRNYILAYEWYTKAAKQLNRNSQCNLSVLYSKGNGVNQDFQQAFTWFTKSAEQDYDNAQYLLGLMYECGEYVEQDHAQALSLYTKASNNNGCGDAQYCRGLLYYNGRGLEKDYIEAYSWFKKAEIYNKNEFAFLGHHV
jgi:TPR repeat protein